MRHAAQLPIQAHMLLRTGEAEMGLGVLDRAQAWMERTGSQSQEAEVWRMRGELLLAGRALTPGPSPLGRGETVKAEPSGDQALLGDPEYPQAHIYVNSPACFLRHSPAGPGSHRASGA